jgi:hypothetical protein
MTGLNVLPFGVSKETIALLRYLLRMALRGELSGIVVCYCILGKGDKTALSGIYHFQPKLALAAADLITFTAARQLELFI